MSQKKQKAKGTAEFKKFGGIDCRLAPLSKESCADIKNFRVLPNGSLAKRSGYRPAMTYSGAVRAVYSGRFQDMGKIFVLAGNRVYFSDLKQNENFFIGEVMTTAGKASFTVIHDCLYLFDGNEVYEIFEDKITVAQGYVPLVGQNWTGLKVGEEYEKPNILSRRTRVSYYVDSAYYVTYLSRYTITGVEAVYVNDIKLDVSAYTPNLNLNGVEILGLKAGDKILVYFKHGNYLENISGFFSCNYAAVFGDMANPRVFLWGGNDKKVVYFSEIVSDANMAESAKHDFGNNQKLYFPYSDKYKIKESRYDITALATHHDRLLIFTKGNTWYADKKFGEEGNFPIYLTNSSIGCSVPFGVSYLANDPVTVGTKSIYRWSQYTDTLDESNAVSLSGKIENCLNKSVFTNSVIYKNHLHNEILLSDLDDAEGSVWIYNTETDEWYRFTDIFATSFFYFDSVLCFTKENTVFVFDENIYEDIAENGEANPIKALYRSNPLAFWDSSQTKRLLGVNINAITHGGKMSAKFIADGENILETGLVQNNEKATGSLYRRLNSGKFRYLELELYSDDTSRPQIFSAAVEVK